MQHLLAAAPGRQHGVDLGAVEDGAHTVAVARQQAGQHTDKLARHTALGELVGAEVDAAAQVDQKPGTELAVFGELAHMGHLQPGRDVPVDVAHVVVELVFAQVGQVETAAAPQGAVVALQLAIEPAQHRPFEALEQGFGAAVHAHGSPATRTAFLGRHPSLRLKFSCRP